MRIDSYPREQGQYRIPKVGDQLYLIKGHYTHEGFLITERVAVEVMQIEVLEQNVSGYIWGLAGNYHEYYIPFNLNEAKQPR